MSAPMLGSATHAWCVCCGAISRGTLVGPRCVATDNCFKGHDLKCDSCGFTIATIYEATATDSCGGASDIEESFHQAAPSTMATA